MMKRVENQESRVKILLAIVFTIAFSLVPSASVYADHCGVNPNSRATYCNPATKTLWIDQPCDGSRDANYGHTNTGQVCGVEEVFGKIETPINIRNIGFGSVGLNNLFIFAVRFLYSLAGLVLLFMIIMGGWEWLTSGGDKEKIASARKRIFAAIIGISIMALAFFIVGVLGKIINFDFNNIGVRVLKP